VEVLQQIFSPPPTVPAQGLIEGGVVIDAELKIDAKLYLFLSPHSYTGEDLGEIHIHTNRSVAEALLGRLLAEGLRTAGPGEFTARAYLNGKIDLAAAEAVNEIITSSNRFQLAAGQRLLAGRLGESSAEIGSSIMSCLSQIEASLDFSGEDIEFISRPEAIRKLAGIKQQIEQLLADSISDESVIDLPAVGITGAAGAGKSSLLNKLLGSPRSIVSPPAVPVGGSQYRGTTRDVLTGEFSLPCCRCIVFDCAGLMLEPNNILDELAEAAAIEALRRALVVVFCVDISRPGWAEDVAIRRLLKPQTVISVATKSDLLSEDILDKRLSELNELFESRFIAISARTDAGMGLLRDTIDKKLLETQNSKPDTRATAIALTARHRQAITRAIENIVESISELKAGNEEVAACMLRTAYKKISDMDSSIDEKILENIFQRFCIGK
jgi:tRNA modification GTPase